MEQQHTTPTTQPHTIKRVDQTTCCIVGGGPAGALLALLLARKGISVMLLEAHMDFDRDFRGDTIHSSTMEIMDQLGLADRLLQIPHTRMSTFALQTGTTTTTPVNLGRLKTKFPYTTVMAQARFLEFITQEAQRYDNFRLVMGAQVDGLIEEDGVVRGVCYRGQDGWYEVRAVLTVGADGRFSRVRKLAGFEPIKTSVPMDVLWFRLPRKESDPFESLGGRFVEGGAVVLINRFDYWQAGFIIPKGGYQQLKAQGLEHFRQRLAEILPPLADRVDELQEWKQIAVLSVESSRIPRWYRAGLLLIGDAAHVMSPAGGVGINYAIQDAVVAANILTPKLQDGMVSLRDLAKVQRERELPTRIIQALQSFLQDQMISKMLSSNGSMAVPFILSFLVRLPFLRDMPARLIAFGPRRVRLQQA